VRIPELSYHKLRALAPLLELPNGNLASRLLVAAINDAIDSLPDEEGTWGPNYPYKMTAKHYVMGVVQDSFMDAGRDEEYQPTLATFGEKLMRGRKKETAESTATEAP
jgi:hypothetical protein